MYIYICMYVCMYICMYICICMTYLLLSMKGEVALHLLYSVVGFTTRVWHGKAFHLHWLHLGADVDLLL